jgi:DNA-binding transcriptional LysR family regulator
MVNLAAIDLNLLWVLHAVLAERGVARAAARLRVTSPAVSNALARLRAALGDPLFVRSGRGLAPTPRALELAPVLARSFGDLEAALRAGAAFDARACTRELTIALSDAEQIAALSRVARAFARRLPRARLRVVTLDTLVSSGGLAGPTVDVTIGPPFDEDGVRRRPLFAEEAAFVVRRGHPRVGRSLSRERFNAERHVDVHLLLGRGGAGHRSVNEALASAGLVRQIAVTVPTFAAAAGVVAATDLVAGMPKRVARLLGRMLPIRAVKGPGPPFRFEMCLHWHERTHGDPAAAAFRELIVEALGAPTAAPVFVSTSTAVETVVSAGAGVRGLGACRAATG